MVNEVWDNILIVTADFLEKEVKASYSGDTIAERGSKVKRPFKSGVSQWVCVAYDGDDCGCYRLVPQAEYTGPTRTYAVPTGREYDEYYEELKKDPNGSFHGMLVKLGKKDCVLMGPVVRFRAEKPKETQEPKNKPMSLVVVPKKTHPKIETSQDNLRCVLKDSELLELGRQQARALSDIEAAEEELKSFSTGIKNRVALSEATIKSVSKKIREGYEFRYVATTVTTDYAAGLVTFVRNDTGETYSQRPLNNEERQFKMDLEADMKASAQASFEEIFPKETGEGNSPENGSTRGG
jgi:cellobiose-specific phosphotransferase system component IIB